MNNIVEIAIVMNTCIQSTWFIWVIYSHYKTEHKGDE